jgi:hypothetical protein
MTEPVSLGDPRSEQTSPKTGTATLSVGRGPDFDGLRMFVLHSYAGPPQLSNIRICRRSRSCRCARVATNADSIPTCLFITPSCSHLARSARPLR